MCRDGKKFGNRWSLDLSTFLLILKAVLAEKDPLCLTQYYKIYSSIIINIIIEEICSNHITIIRSYVKVILKKS